MRSTSSPTRSSWPATSSTRSRSSSTASCKREGIERRLTDSLETALRLADGVAEVQIVPQGRRGRDRDAHVQPAPGLPDVRPLLRGAGAPQLLVQLALRRLRALRRPRHPVRGRPRAGRAQPRPDRRPRAPSRRGPAGARQYFARLLESVCADQRHRPTTCPGRSSPRPSRSCCSTAVAGRVQGAVQEPLRPQPQLRRQVRGRRPVPAAPPHRGRERRPARADRGLHARGAVPRVRRRPAQAAVAGGHHRRPQHRRHLADVDPRRGRGARGASP